MKQRKTRQELFNEFVKKDSDFENYFQDIVTVGDKTFLIKKMTIIYDGIGYSKFIEKVRLYSNMFGINHIYESTPSFDYESRMNHTLTNNVVMYCSGSTMAY